MQISELCILQCISPERPGDKAVQCITKCNLSDYHIYNVAFLALHIFRHGLYVDFTLRVNKFEIPLNW